MKVLNQEQWNLVVNALYAKARANPLDENDPALALAEELNQAGTELAIVKSTPEHKYHENWQDDYKEAYMYVYASPVGTVGFPGVVADLFFSSPETFAKLWGRPLDSDGSETLVKVLVPKDFEDWDYVPNDY